MESVVAKRDRAQFSALVKTPRRNRHLPQVLGDFDTLTEGLDYAARGATGFNFYSSRGLLEHVVPYSELRSRSLATARKLLALGLKRGDRVALIAETGPDFLAAFMGCQYAGLIPCPMPYTIHIGGAEAYVERVTGMLRAAAACAVVSASEVESYVRQAAKAAEVPTALTYGELALLPESAVRLEPFRAGESAYIQYSSGSTSSPKGVLISQRAITANCRAILRDGMAMTPEDRAFSWLPLYHDMGLVGFCLSPLMGQVTVDYLATTAFARRPILWLKLMSDNRSTVAYSPSFGYELAARRIGAEAQRLDLSAWRTAGIGGDMVRAEVLREFAEQLAPAGFSADAFVPSYGLAEATLGVSLCPQGRGLKVDTIDRAAYKAEGKAVPASGDPATGRSFVVCGSPFPGHEVVIRGEQGEVLGERRIGRIFVLGPSLMDGYYRDEEATAAAIGADGTLDTGDMGYWLDGEIVITGRAKDLILHNGRNIWPQDIEWAAEQVEPLRAGDVAAFAVEGDNGEDQVVVLVECRLKDEAAVETLRREVSRVVHHSAGVECQVAMVAPKSLPFTSSGKLSRAGAKRKYLSGEIAALTLQPRFLEAAE